MADNFSKDNSSKQWGRSAVATSSQLPESKVIPYAPAGKYQSTEEIEEKDKTALQHSYSVWILMKQGGKQEKLENNYESVVKEVAKFSTVQDFWGIYQHLRRPAYMHFGTFMHVFVEGVKPVWEDEQCKNGGRFQIRLAKTHGSKFWEDLLLAMIGEQFEAEGAVLGVMISLRPNGDTISVWNRDGRDESQIASIRKDLETKIWKMEEGIHRLDYEVFADLINKDHDKHANTNEGGEESKQQSKWAGNKSKDTQ